MGFRGAGGLGGDGGRLTGGGGFASIGRCWGLGLRVAGAGDFWFGEVGGLGFREWS